MRTLAFGILVGFVAGLAHPGLGLCQAAKDPFEHVTPSGPALTSSPEKAAEPRSEIGTQSVPGVEACRTGTARDPRSGRCMELCPDGRLEVAPGQCCWPGQDVGVSTGRCLGAVAYCPAGTLPNPHDPEDCLRQCPDGRIEVADGHCCWPGQAWDGKCSGPARCPAERSQNPRNPTECARRCTGGRLEVAPGHCCQPGETWTEETQRCAGAASCPAGTMANPRDVTQCLGICDGLGLEVAPGHCCWPGQHWNIDRGECSGRALACLPHMRLSAQGECLSVDGPCQSNADCDADSGCLAGRCMPARRFRRIEVFADGMPVVLGSWSITDGGSTGSPTLAGGDFASRGGLGLAVRASWAIHPRWSLGPYLGYQLGFDRSIDLDKPNSLHMESRTVHLSMVRLGGLVNHRWPVRRALAAGLGLEAGLLFGTTGGDEMPFGVEIGPDFFLDFPLGADAVRPHLTLSLGFRAGTMDRHIALPDYSYAHEWWYYFMPVARVGVGVGR